MPAPAGSENDFTWIVNRVRNLESENLMTRIWREEQNTVERLRSCALLIAELAAATSIRNYEKNIGTSKLLRNDERLPNRKKKREVAGNSGCGSGWPAAIRYANF